MFFFKPKWPPTLEVSHLNKAYAVVLKPSDKAKRMTLRVKAAEREIVLTAPPKTRLGLIEDFANRYAGWIASRYEKLPVIMPLTEGAILPFKGKAYTIIHSKAASGVELRDDEIHVGGEALGLKRRLKTFVLKEAKAALTTSSHFYAEQLNVSITSITLRDTTSRWGSCSSRGSLNYSWRIVLAPPFVLDYLCAHEVSHRLEMNHSDRFWKLVEQLYPDYDVAEKWLKKHGSSLHAVQI